MIPIDFNAHDAWTSDENVAMFPSTVTIQWRLPWPRMNDFAVHLLYMYVFGSKQYITVSQLGHIGVLLLLVLFTFPPD